MILLLVIITVLSNDAFIVRMFNDVDFFSFTFTMFIYIQMDINETEEICIYDINESMLLFLGKCYAFIGYN